MNNRNNRDAEYEAKKRERTAGGNNPFVTVTSQKPAYIPPGGNMSNSASLREGTHSAPSTRFMDQPDIISMSIREESVHETKV